MIWNPNCYSEIRCDDDGDGADSGDDVDDDPDDARRDDDDGDDDFPLREVISPAESPLQEGLSLCRFCREEAAEKI